MQPCEQVDTGVDVGRNETALTSADPVRPGRVRVWSLAARAAAVLLAAIAARLALPLQAQAQTTVPDDWALIPSGLGEGDSFRLLFLSSTKRNGSSSAIGDYNTFIQNRAATGHTAIQEHSSEFKVVGCTSATDARDNTATTGTGVPIYWLNGNKAADDYADFYDGSWDEEASDKNESGNNGPDTSHIANHPFTGCAHNGTESFSASDSYALGSGFLVRLGLPNSFGSGDGPLSSTSTALSTPTRPMYGLSPVFTVEATDTDTTPPALTSAVVITTGTAIAAVFDEELDVSNLAPASAFSVTAGGSAVSVTEVDATNITNRGVTLGLGSTITQGQTVTLSYTDPTGGDDANALQDAAGNDVASFTLAVTNNSTVDTTAPSPAWATVATSGTVVTVTFNEDLDLAAEFLPAAVVDAFTVTADGVDLDIDRVASGAPTALAIRLPTGTTIYESQTVTLSYDKTAAGTDALEDAAGNEVASFTDFAVANDSTVTVASADATLSDLALENADDDSTIALDQTFATATKSYTASVANGVDEITVLPETTDDGATVEYLDGSDVAITDADGVKADQQVALSEGVNTIKVKVTAEDTTTTDTYTVVVVREASAPTPDPDAVWTANLTVRNISGTLGCTNGFTNNFCSVHLSDDCTAPGSLDTHLRLRDLV